MIELHTTLGKFGEFWAQIFWLARVGRIHLVNLKFSKLRKEIAVADPSYD